MYGRFFLCFKYKFSRNGRNLHTHTHTHTHTHLVSGEQDFSKQNICFKRISVLFFLLFIVLFANPAFSESTTTTKIYYYFNLEDKIGGSEIITDESETDESEEACNLTCSGATPYLDVDKCECYCGVTCESGEYFDASGCSCKECPTPTNVTCPTWYDKDENGCPIYIKKICQSNEYLNDDCECVCQDGYVEDSSGICIEKTVENYCPNANYEMINGNCVCDLQCDSGKQANSSCSACVCPTTENCEGNFTWNSESCSCVCNKAGEKYGVNMHYDPTTCEPVCDTGLVSISSTQCANCNHTTHDGCGGGMPYCNIYNTCVECYSDSHCASDEVCQNGVCVDECTVRVNKTCCDKKGGYWCGDTCYSSALSEGYCTCSGGTWQGQSCCWGEICADQCQDLTGKEQCECYGGTWY